MPAPTTATTPKTIGNYGGPDGRLRPTGLGDERMSRTVEYKFRYLDVCNMCGSHTDNHRVLGRRLNTRQGLRPQKKVAIATTVLRCAQCGLIYAQPMPVPMSVQQHYGTLPESYWNKRYFTLDANYLNGQLKQFESLYGRTIRGANLTALDVGAGIGKAMRALSSAGFDAYGVEPSEQFHKRAIDKMEVSERRLKLTTIEEANFEEASFDFINMAAVVEHLYDPSAVIQKAVRWLRPGGLIHIEVPCSDYLMSTLARQFYRWTGSDYVTNICPMHAPYHLFEFTRQSFMLHANLHHYRIAHYQYYVCESYMPRLIKPLFNLVMKLSNTGMQLAIWLTK